MKTSELLKLWTSWGPIASYNRWHVRQQWPELAAELDRLARSK